MLEALSYQPMGPLQYRNFGDHETLLFNHTVNVDGMGRAGIRWYELRRTPPGGTPPGAPTWKIFQQGTFSPDSNHRWMGSIAMDGAGNIALGYSVSNQGFRPEPGVLPGIRIVGRLAGDNRDLMTTPEVHLADGRASKTCKDTCNPPNVLNCRWGDYSAMRVDPADDCTFWYTTEYINDPKAPTHPGQQTHIGAVRFPFPTCIPPPADLAIRLTGPEKG